MSEASLRERKKVETRRDIARAAVDLAAERGPDGVTVDDIAQAAGVSPRTVFNHFGTKDEAILGIDPERRAHLIAEVAGRPERETPLRAIAAVLINAMTTDAEAAEFWLRRAEIVRDHPQLRAAQLSSQTELERDLAVVVAARTGLEVDRHPYPELVATTALAAVRLVLRRSGGGGLRRLRRHLEDAFTLLESGLLPPPKPTRGTR